jgi:hypothetical protein
MKKFLLLATFSFLVALPCVIAQRAAPSDSWPAVFQKSKAIPAESRFAIAAKEARTLTNAQIFCEVSNETNEINWHDTGLAGFQQVAMVDVFIPRTPLTKLECEDLIRCRQAACEMVELKRIGVRKIHRTKERTYFSRGLKEWKVTRTHREKDNKSNTWDKFMVNPVVHN